MFYYVTHTRQGQDTSKAQDTQEQCIAEVLVIAYTNTSPARITSCAYKASHNTDNTLSIFVELMQN